MNQTQLSIFPKALVVLLFSHWTSHAGDMSASTLAAWGRNLNGQCNVPAWVTNPSSVAAGHSHVLALQPDGTVAAWGDNLRGQTNVPATATNLVAIAAGRIHSLALRDDGSVVAWGAKTPTNTGPQALVPPSATNVIAISAGSEHSLALRADGTVVAWGDNDDYQLRVPAWLTNAIAISAGYTHNLALRKDHTVVTWGSQYEVPSAATNVIAMAAGFRHNLVLRADGSVLGWGDNTYGQAVPPSSVTNAVAVAAGFDQSMALLANGTVVAWGTAPVYMTNAPNGLGNVSSIALGQDFCLALIKIGAPQFKRQAQSIDAHVGGQALLTTEVEGTSPLQCQWYCGSDAVPGATNRWLSLQNVQASDEGSYTLVVTNAAGQATSDPVTLTVSSAPNFNEAPPLQQNYLVGKPISLSVSVNGARPLHYQFRANNHVANSGWINGAEPATFSVNSASFAEAGYYSLVVTNAYGSVTGFVANVAVTPIAAWGNNVFGQIDVPAQATNVIAIAGGTDHSLALRTDGTVVAWGDNASGQCDVPASLNSVKAIAAGSRHSLALLAGGSVVAWGDNTYGQSTIPVFTSPVVDIAAGNTYSLAVTKDGNVVVWGKAASTGLVTVSPPAVTVAASAASALALTTAGTVEGVWGGDFATNGLVGITAGLEGLALRHNGTVVDSINRQVASLTNVVAISAQSDHCMALLADGTIWAGTKTNLTSYGPTNVPASLNDVIAISAGDYHNLALVQSSTKIAVAGDSLRLVAGSFGGGETSYQWQLNGANIVGATNATLLLENVRWTNAGIYRVIVQTPLRTVTGLPIDLSIPRTPLQFDNPACVSEATSGGVRVRLLGASGVGSVTIYASTNLVNWAPVWTNTASLAPIEFVDATGTNLSARFYRAAEQP